MVVQSKLTILYLKLGSVYYPIACGTDSRINTTSEEIELAPRSSTRWREYKYGRLSGTITGNHLVRINTSPDNLYTVFDLVGFQFSGLDVLVKYSVDDGAGSVRVFECNSIVRSFELNKTAGQALRGGYELLISGPVTVSATPVENTNPQILIYEYVSAGGESSLVLPFGDSATILVVYVNGQSVRVYLAPNGYGPSDVQYDPETKTLLFGTPLTVDDYVKILYVDVYGAVPSGARTTGDGAFRTTGEGFRTVGG